MKILELLRRKRSVGKGALSLAPGIAISKHPDGVIFLDSETGSVYTANGTGARIFEALRQGMTPEAVGAALALEAGAPAELVAGDAACFAAELEAQGILRRTGRAA
jgi:hypothetical protein